MPTRKHTYSLGVLSLLDEVYHDWGISKRIEHNEDEGLNGWYLQLAWKDNHPRTLLTRAMLFD